MNKSKENNKMREPIIFVLKKNKNGNIKMYTKQFIIK